MQFMLSGTNTGTVICSLPHEHADFFGKEEQHWGGVQPKKSSSRLDRRDCNSQSVSGLERADRLGVQSSLSQVAHWQVMLSAFKCWRTVGHAYTKPVRSALPRDTDASFSASQSGWSVFWGKYSRQSAVAPPSLAVCDTNWPQQKHRHNQRMFD